jgi:proteasome lid subunit RPN8/RPN11
MSTATATRIETRGTPAEQYEVRSLTDEIHRLDLVKAYGEVGGMDTWLMESIRLEEQRIRDGVRGNRMQTDPAEWRREVRMVEDYIARRYGLEDELRSRRSRESVTRSTSTPARPVRPAPAEHDRWWERDQAEPEQQWWPDGEAIPVYQVAGESVSITHRAYQAIRDECERWDGSVETGGGLVINASGSRPAIFTATVEASNRREASVSVDPFAIRTTARHVACEATARITPGHWHSHPGDGCEPSHQDFNVWGRLLEESRSSEIVALIVTEHRDGGWWRVPQLHGFRVRFGHKPSGVRCLRVEACHVDVVS